MKYNVGNKTMSKPNKFYALAEICRVVALSVSCGSIGVFCAKLLEYASKHTTGDALFATLSGVGVLAFALYLLFSVLASRCE